MPTYPIQFRRDTPENWQAANPVLREGEMGIELPGTVGENGVEAFKYKIGDGVRAWNDLPYASGPAGPSPEYEWNGTSIRFKNPDGTWGDYIDIQGPQGVQGEQGEPGPAGEAVPATTTTIGGVIVGENIQVDNGCISVNNGGTTQKGVVQLTDAVDSDTGTLAASDRAVKTLHDRLSGEGIPANSRMWIGVPRFWRSTTLPPNHCWANGDFISFADWPELKAVYESGGFDGLLLNWNANGPTQAANLGRWRPDAAEPTGLFTPNLVGQYLRGWGQNAPQGAGGWQNHAMQQWYGHLYREETGDSFSLKAFGAYSGSGGMVGTVSPGTANSYTIRPYTSKSATTLANMADETRPVTVWQPVILYLGQPAKEAA